MSFSASFCQNVLALPCVINMVPNGRLNPIHTFFSFSRKQMWNEWNIPQLADFSDPKCGSHQMWKSFFKHRLFSLFLSFWPTLGAHDGLESIFKQQGRQIRLRNGRETVLRNGRGPNDLASMMMK